MATKRRSPAYKNPSARTMPSKKHIARRRVLAAVLLIAIVVGVSFAVLLAADFIFGDPGGYPYDNGEQQTYTPDPIIPSNNIELIPIAPSEYLYTPGDSVDNSSITETWYLILVSPRQALPEGFAVELEYITGTLAVDVRIADPLRRLFAAATADGISLTLRSAYRSVERQRELFYGNISRLENEGNSRERAVYLTEMYFARPGHSEHHTGLAVDILSPAHPYFTEAFENTPAFAWLSENAHSFGFILRYPRDRRDITGITYEPWHFRYVGLEAAEEIFRTGWTLEEFLFFRQINTATANDVDDHNEDEEYEPEAE